MHHDYPKKKFTLDGRLVGDIGEILAEELYDLDLLEGMQRLHDACSKGKMVQIKTTMKSTLGFGDIPDFYLGLKVDQKGKVEEIFNGPGSVIWDAIKHRKRPKSYLLSIDINNLKKLNKLVSDKDKIQRRSIL
jgi:hypothetical protein